MMSTSSVKDGGSPKKGKPLSEEEVKKGHCSHGANGKCVNCLDVNKDTAKLVKHKCVHPPG